MEITSRSKEECAIALQDCNNDTDKAVNMILEGKLDYVSFIMPTWQKLQV